MKFIPHAYQKYAIEYIEQHERAAVFLDMGLGKTVTTLTALKNLFDRREIRSVLIVAPLRVARDVWPAEINKWDHLKELSYSVAVGTAAERKRALEKEADIYIINRDCVSWMASNFPHLRFDMVVIDELSSFKNGQCKRFGAMLAYCYHARRVVGLTGTPSTNGLMDLWAEFRLLDNGERLGRYYTTFRTIYCMPYGPKFRNHQEYRLKPGADSAIYEAIDDMTISMRSMDYLQMPELIESEYPVFLNNSESNKYEELKKQLRLQTPEGDISAVNARTLAGKLAQMANGTAYLNDGSAAEIHSRKLDALEDIIEAANGKPLLLAYYYKHDLERIKKRLNELAVEYAEIRDSNSIEKWNAGELQVGLIHPASSGHGLNLQSGGSTIVWYSLPWSLELYQQTNSRLWRQGQKDRTVVLIHIIAKGTIDERILQVLQRKESGQAALIEAVKAEIGC